MEIVIHLSHCKDFKKQYLRLVRDWKVALSLELVDKSNDSICLADHLSIFIKVLKIYTYIWSIQGNSYAKTYQTLLLIVKKWK